MPFKNTHLDPEENPFSSKNYPFNKEWNKYDTKDLGKAFFSDGNIKSMGMLMVYDHIKLFSNSNFGFSNEPLYYKHYEIKLYIYTLDDYSDLKDKYYKADLEFDQICVFFCKQENEIITKIKLGDSLQKYSKFENIDQTANFTISKPLSEIQKLELSTKKIIDFLSQDKPLFKNDFIQNYKNIELKEVYFLDEQEKMLILEHDYVLEMPVSNILYGEKVKIRVTGDQIQLHTPITIKLIAKSENENQKFEGIEKMVWEARFDKNIAETPYFQIPLTWFDESIEIYNYRKNKDNPIESEPKAYKTTFKEKLPEFSIEVSYSKVQKLTNKEEHTLIPTSYRRNYEELVGLFALDNSGNKTTDKNYENDFISKNKEIEKIVTAFTKYIYEFPAEIYKYKKGLETYYKPKEKKEFELRELKKRVEKDATELWKKAVEPFQEYRSTKNYDDRPLYWARLKMQSQLKRLPIFKDDIGFDTSQVKKGTKLEEIIMLFEEKSRNYTGINFGYSRPFAKKILITGYDPFVLNPEMSGNILQSNPSGCVALWLAGNEFEFCNIQTMIMPVRYADFDDFKNGKGVVETFIEPWISKVDMIITVSQGGIFRFDVDRFPCKHRGGYMDNMFWGNEDSGYNSANFKQISEGKEFYETTLPFEKIVPAHNKIEDLFWTFFNQNFIAKDKSEKIIEFKDEKREGVAKIEDDKIISGLNELQTYTSIEGSGGDYLSNEIFYRVAKLRTEKKSELKTGHLHIPLIQSKNLQEQYEDATPLQKERYKNDLHNVNKITKDINPFIGKLLLQVKEIIKKTLIIFLLFFFTNTFAQPTPAKYKIYVEEIDCQNFQLSEDKAKPRKTGYITTYIYLKRDTLRFNNFLITTYLNSKNINKEVVFIYENDTLKINFELPISFNVNTSRSLQIKNICFHKNTTTKISIENYEDKTIDYLLCNCIRGRKDEND